MKFSQLELVSILKEKKDVYPHKVSKIQINETHISWIFLTGSHAYKIKKELKFGDVLDFSTLQLRKKICQKEVKLNRILCGKMYEGVVKIVQDNNKLKITDLNDHGNPIEFAVKMLEIPQKYRMDKLLLSNKIKRNTINELTKILVKFHQTTPTSAKIEKFGKSAYMLKKVRENFKTLKELAKIDPKFETRLVSFIKNNEKLFSNRIKAKKIRDIHGDLYLKNIFIVNKHSKFYLYDRLEFNDSLRYADVAEDVAHLCMDLDLHKRKEIRNYFISQYMEKSKDRDLKKLLYFLMCYKACMRGKVSFFQAKNEKNPKRRATQIKESRNLFQLADSYLSLF
jgi:aminoglycoside phosphotransferase family enzyme